MEREIYQLHSCCKLTKGFNRAVITDLQRGRYFTVPLSLYELLVKHKKASIEEVKSQYQESSEEGEIINEYFSFLLENEIIFTINESLADRFLPIETEFDYPGIISNAIILLNEFDNVRIEKILVQLKSLFCYNIEITVLNPINKSELDILLQLCKTNEMDNVIILINQEVEIDLAYILENYLFLNSLIFFNAAVDYDHLEDVSGFHLKHTTTDLGNPNRCGLVDSKYFTPTIGHFTESQKHNTCLNRKISIDAEGNIKNCPGLKENFGNIKNTTLLEAIHKPGFKKYWEIKKDEINICRDCEFRHVCTDCRAYVDNPNDTYSKPLKCGYNPYTSKWEDWSTHPMKQAAIKYYALE